MWYAVHTTYFILYTVCYTCAIYLEVFHMLSAGNIWLCNSGITLWPAGTMPLTDLYHVRFWTCTFRMERTPSYYDILSLRSIFMKLTWSWNIQKTFLGHCLLAINTPYGILVFQNTSPPIHRYTVHSSTIQWWLCQMPHLCRGFA